VRQKYLASKIPKAPRQKVLPRDPAPIADAIGASAQMFGVFEQIFGANQQVPHVGGSDKEAETAARRHLVRWPS